MISYIIINFHVYLPTRLILNSIMFTFSYSINAKNIFKSRICRHSLRVWFARRKYLNCCKVKINADFLAKEYQFFSIDFRAQNTLIPFGRKNFRYPAYRVTPLPHTHARTHARNIFLIFFFNYFAYCRSRDLKTYIQFTFTFIYIYIFIYVIARAHAVIYVIFNSFLMVNFSL